MTLEVVLQTISSLAVVCGGIWTIYKFRKEVRPNPTLIVQILSTRQRSERQSRTIHLRFQVKNDGRVRIKHDRTYVTMGSVETSALAELERLDTLTKLDSAYELFGEHKWLEPGEVFSEDMILSTADDPYLKLQMTLLSHKTRWMPVSPRKRPWLAGRPNQPMHIRLRKKLFVLDVAGRYWTKSAILDLEEGSPGQGS